jgi:hypothetical protein
MSEPEKSIGLRYAEDVIAVYEAGMECDKDWPIRRRELHAWANLGENREKFYSQLVPKAAEVLHKHSGDDDADFIAREERRSVNDLKLLLKETLASVK